MAIGSGGNSGNLQISGNYTIGAAAGTTASVTVGGSTGIGTLTFPNAEIALSTLTVNAAATNTSLFLGGTTSGAAVLNLNIGGGTTDVISTTGKLAVNTGGAVINLATLPSTTLGIGTYNLINYATSTVPTITLGLNSPPPGETFYLNPSATAEQLVVATAAGAVNVYWAGGVNAAWNTAPTGTTNFVTAASGGTNSLLPGTSSNVFFAATGASNLSSTLGQGFTINSLNFTAASAVTVAGNASTPLQITAAAGYGSYAAGTGIVVQAGVTAANTISAPIVLAANQNWNVNGGSLTVSGGITGAYNLAMNNNSTGTIVFSTASINNAGTIMNSGTGVSPIPTAEITAPPAGSTYINAPVGANVTGIIQNSASSALALNAIGAAYNGGITVQNGVLLFSGLANSLGANTNVITLGTSSTTKATLQFAAKINNASTSQTFYNPINVGGTGTEIISASDYQPTFAGPITLNNPSNGLTIAGVNTGFSYLSFSGGINGTGNIVFSSGGGGNGNNISFSTNPVNNIGTITFNNASVNGSTPGTNTQTNSISGGVGSNVTAIIQASNYDPLSIGGANLNVNNTGTNLTSTGIASFTISSNVVGSGNLIVTSGSSGTFADSGTISNAGNVTLYANSSGSINLSGASVNNGGYIASSGTAPARSRSVPPSAPASAA